MHFNVELTEARIERLLNERIAPAIHHSHVPVQLAAWEAPGEPVPAAEALAQPFAPFMPGQPWGKAWSTWWFELRGTVPMAWTDQQVELIIDPGFQGDWPGNQVEGLVYDADGVPVKGIHPRNFSIVLPERSDQVDTDIHYYLEAAANPDIGQTFFRPTKEGDRLTSSPKPIYTFKSAQIAILDPTVFGLYFDVEVLLQLSKELPANDARKFELLTALTRAMDELALDDISGTASTARGQLAGVLALPATRSAHTLSAVGHAHIDSAWLWPVRETIRKTGRTFANVTWLAEQYEDFKFACSSAQQYAWIKEHQPEVFERIKASFKRGQWIPVGGMWVEADANLPGGEALVRQFLQGKNFFKEELDANCKGVWLPDSFGYSAALPQIAALAGMEWMLTQKLSWSQTNKFPHHTFLWEGIDGTRIFTHFPPVDNYVSTLEAEELHHAAHNYAEKGHGTRSLVPFGYGDGGGGPTRDMMERYQRVRNLEGSPRVEIEHPDDFFAKAREEYTNPPVWAGELYLELHRATATSQAHGKSGNRRSEHLLRETELLCTMASLRAGRAYPHEELTSLWRQVLLLQFHDILPGSSIAWVHREQKDQYTAILAALARLGESARAALSVAAGSGHSVLNGASHSRREVVDVDGQATLVEVAGSSLENMREVAPANPVSVNGSTVGNGLVTIHFDDDGLLDSVFDHRFGRELLPAGGRANLLQLHQDLPNAWDAWDLDEHYRNKRSDITDVSSITVVEDSPLRATVEVVRTFSQSRIVQRISLSADSPRIDIDCTIDWQEKEKILKASFPLSLRAEHYSSEIQFGHLRRPVHANTSWDAAKFEVAGQRFVHVEESGFGAAVVNDSTYGHDVTRRMGDDGETITEIRLSLLRAPQSPAPDADAGEHSFKFALLPGASMDDAVRAGYELNLPLRVAGGTTVAAGSLVSVDSPAVHIEAVKLAEDGSGDVVVRLYEALGGRAQAFIGAGFDHSSVVVVDLLEQPLDSVSMAAADGGATVTLRPFQILTLRFGRRQEK